MDNVIAMSLPARAAQAADEEHLMPPESRLDMPVQSLTHWSRDCARPAVKPDAATIRRRVVVFGLTLGLTAIGTWEIFEVVRISGVTWLQTLFAALFALTFAWIAFASATAVVGFWLILTGKVAGGVEKEVRGGGLGRNALVMPIYSEDTGKVFAALEAMARDLAANGLGSAFDIVVLSDTRDATIAEAEEAAARRLRASLAPYIALHYRRRRDNRHKKAGNIADFVTRWGGHYDHMVVLDADSTMRAATLAALARHMATDPDAGIIQSLPVLAGRHTLFARLQQFAARAYGPVVGAGIAAWHGRDGNYWGHNAIIRVKAFAEAAGLPELPGRRPFGGHILSHDFVEAALVRRAGWSVYMLPALAGSFEESPPNLLDLAARDRRWAQGNLQHLKVVTAKGLHWANRVHLVQGVMSYLASPLWLALILAGLGLSLQARFVVPDYFPDGFALFPTWPVFDHERALRLFAVTLAVLFLPKLLGTARILMDRRERASFGGARAVISSLIAEILLSSLVAPVMMLVQSRAVIDILVGRDSGWASQNRSDRGPSLAAAARFHALHLLAGVALLAASAAVSFDAVLWMLPIAPGLILSGPLSWAMGDSRLGRRARSVGLFLTPEEVSGAVERTRVHDGALRVAAQ